MPMPQPEIPLQPHNNTEMTRDMLITVLTYFSTLIPKYFNNLPLMPPKSYGAVYNSRPTFRLGADWMNSDADIALPMAIDVTPFWAVALKLVRYTKWDPGDICLLLRHGTALTSMTWTTELLEGWLRQFCAPMRYTSYDAAKIAEMRGRIAHAIKGWEMTVSASAASSNASESALAAMGGETSARITTETRTFPTWMNQTSASSARTRWGPIPQDGRWTNGVDAQQPHQHEAERHLRHKIPKPRSEMRHDTVVVDSRGAPLHPGSAAHIARSDAAMAAQSARRKRERRRDKEREKDRSFKWQAQSDSDSEEEDGVNPGAPLHRSMFQIYQQPPGRPPQVHDAPPPYSPEHARAGPTYQQQQQQQHNAYHQPQHQHQSHRNPNPLYHQQHQSTNTLGLY
ncbi:hypothetical protein BD779DRAFT_1473937 [Infundibulicybe gibba]|nr:hypothetical protein BD779DRAFT_1473937 [Infundibulicybe gibba]